MVLLALALLAGVGRGGVAGRSLSQAAAPAAERAATAFEVTYGGYQNFFHSDGVASGEGKGPRGWRCPRRRLPQGAAGRISSAEGVLLHHCWFLSLSLAF